MLCDNQASPVALPLLKEKYVWSKLTSDVKTSIMGKLTSFMINEEKPYLNPKISLKEVSSVLDLNPNRLSQVVNETTGLNFKDFINSYSVEVARLLLSSPEFQKLTIEAIVEKAGFYSKAPFYAAFKKHAGMTPKEFIGMSNLTGF